MKQEEDLKTKNHKTKFNWKRLALYGTLFLLVIIAGLFIYLNLRKNDISRDLLGIINEDIKGEFRIGDISIGSLYKYPNLSVTIYNAQLYNEKKDSNKKGELIIDLPEINFNADLSDVFTRKIIINDLILEKAKLFIKRDSTENVLITSAFESLNLNESMSDSTQLFISIPKIEMVHSEVIVSDLLTNTYLPFKIEKLIGSFELKEDSIKGLAKIHFLPFNFVKLDSIYLDDLPLNLHSNYSIDLSKQSLNIQADTLAFEDMFYQANFNLNYSDKTSMELDIASGKNGISLESLLLDHADSIENSEANILNGIGHFKSKITWSSSKDKSFLSSIKASIELEGKDLKLKGLDMDQMLQKFKRSQNFNIADFGAVMFAGPAGLAITKGGDFVNLAVMNPGDSTEVKHFLAAWSMEKSILKTEDVALSTKNNLIVTNGWYHMERDSLDLSIKILDKRGCELISQRIYGLAHEPEYSSLNVISAIFGPVKNFFRNTGIFKCKIAYHGKVKHPVLE